MVIYPDFLHKLVSADIVTHKFFIEKVSGEAEINETILLWFSISVASDKLNLTI